MNPSIDVSLIPSWKNLIGKWIAESKLIPFQKKTEERKPELSNEEITTPNASIVHYLENHKKLLLEEIGMLFKKQENAFVSAFAKIANEQSLKSFINEERIRAITREEMEKVFGKIEDPKPVQEVVPTTKKKEHVKEPKKFKVFIYGLKETQLARVKNSVSTNALIVGADSFNMSARAQAIAADQIIVAKWASHAIYNAFEQENPGKTHYVSGGMTMIMQQIFQLIDAHVMKQ